MSGAITVTISAKQTSVEKSVNDAVIQPLLLIAANQTLVAIATC